jgi:hypothetical protein
MESISTSFKDQLKVYTQEQEPLTEDEITQAFKTLDVDEV